jgi:hypothetical protein
MRGDRHWGRRFTMKCVRQIEMRNGLGSSPAKHFTR